jgi:CheY-like chemotaxis protein/HPt (histidine-containing phosphotransfer) domain-containing protein
MSDPRSVQPKLRVLVVDDEPLQIRDIYRALSNDYQVLQATSGARGLQLAQTSAPDILLLDVAMPGLDGYAVCAALRHDPATAEVPVIFLSDPEDAIDRARCIGLGAVDILSKPVVAGLLSATVAKWIRRPANPVSQAGTSAVRADATARLALVKEIDLAAGLRHVAGVQSLYLAVLQKMCLDHDGIAADIKIALAAGNSSAAIGQAHTVKTICNTIGAGELGAMALQIERHLKEAYPGQPDVANFALRYDAMVAAVRQAILT